MIRLIAFKLLQIKCAKLVLKLLAVFKIKKQPANFFLWCLFFDVVVLQLPKRNLSMCATR